MSDQIYFPQYSDLNVVRDLGLTPTYPIDSVLDAYNSATGNYQRLQTVLSDKNSRKPIFFPAGAYFINHYLVTRASSGGPVLLGAGGSANETNEITLISPTDTTSLGYNSELIYLASTGNEYDFNRTILHGRSIGGSVEGIQFKGARVLHNRRDIGTISGVTNSGVSPIVITTHTAHALTTADQVSIYSVSGNTAANGIYVCTVIDANRFSLNHTTGNANYITGGYAYDEGKTGYSARGVTFSRSSTDNMPNPGKWTFKNCTWTACDVAVYAAGTSDPGADWTLSDNNCDHIVFEGYNRVNGDVFLRINNNQAVNYSINHIQMQPNYYPQWDRPMTEYAEFTNFEKLPVFFDMRESAKLVAHHVCPNNQAMILRTWGTNINASRFDIIVNTDSSNSPLDAPIVLVKMEGSTERPLTVRMGGSMRYNYHRPLVYPIGNSYDIELDLTNLVQADKDAWPRGGVKSTDLCMSYRPTIDPAAWFFFGDPTTYGNPVISPTGAGVGFSSVLITGIQSKSTGTTNSIIQTNTTYQGIYTKDAIHHRPAITFDATAGTYYSGLNSVGTGASSFSIEATVYSDSNSNNIRNIANVYLHAGNQRCWNLAVLDDKRVYFQVSRDGSSVTSIFSSGTIPIYQQTYIRATYDGSNGNMKLYMNNVLKATGNAGAGTLYASAAPLLIGADGYNGAPTRTWRGKIFDIKIDTQTLPPAEIAWRRDMIASQCGAPIVVQYTG